MDLSEIAETTTQKTTQKESSKLMDAIELMEEESSAGVTNSLKKRKAQSDLTDEETKEGGDESEEEPAEETKESGDESEEEPAEERDGSEEERTRVNGPYPQWDVDSFDGLEYHSSDEFNEFSNEEHDKLCREFKRVLFANKGFYVPPELISWCHYKNEKVSELY